MQFYFDNVWKRFAVENQDDSLFLYKDEIRSSYKEGDKPPTIQINKKEDDPNRFLLEKDYDLSPKFYIEEKAMWIYSAIEKIKNKIK